MSWEMQVKIQDETGKKVFKSVKCSGKNGYTYRYETKLAAERSLDMCYPGEPSNELRVIEVSEPANMNNV